MAYALTQSRQLAAVALAAMVFSQPTLGEENPVAASARSVIAAPDRPVPARISLAELSHRLEPIGGVGDLPRQNECGIRSLALLLSMSGQPNSLPGLRGDVPIGDRGTAMVDLVSAAARRGLRLEAVHCAPDDLGALPLPAIAQHEPSPVTMLNHFVVLVKLTDRSAVVCDAAAEVIWEIERGDFCELATGNYIVPSTRFTPAHYAAWYLGGIAAVGLATFAGWITDRARATRRPAVKRPRASSLAKASLLVVFVSVAGCDRASDRTTSIDPAPIPGATPTLTVNAEPVGAGTFAADLGILEPDAKVSHTFSLVNATALPLHLEITGASCGCIHPEIDFSDLSPASTAHLSLALDAAGKNPGIVNEYVDVELSGTHERYRFVVEGVLEGLRLSSQQAYVIRQRDLDRQRVPPLELVLVNREAQSPFHAMSIKSTDERVRPQLSQMGVGEPQTRAGRHFERSVSIPVEASGAGRPTEASLEVQYEFKGKILSLTIPVRLLIHP